MENSLKNAFRSTEPQPTVDLIEDALGGTYRLYAETMKEIEGGHGLKPEWRFYRDGGWLCKCLDGKKNFAWICVNEGVATISCYFSARHRSQLLELDLPPELLTAIAQAEMIGKMLPVMIELREDADRNSALKIISFKKTAS